MKKNEIILNQSRINDNITLGEIKNKKILSDNLWDYFKNINEYLNEGVNKYNIQMRIEDTWINIIKKKINEMKEFTIHDNPSLVHKKLREGIKTWEIDAKAKKLKHKHLQKFKTYMYILGDDLLILTFGSCCVNLSHDIWYTNIAAKISDTLVTYVYTTLKKNPQKWYKYTDNLKSEEKDEIFFDFSNSKKLSDFTDFLNLNVSEKMYFGVFFDYLTTEPSNIFIEDWGVPSQNSNRKEPARKLILNSELMDDLKNNGFVDPFNLPMVYKPNNWTVTKHGGYLSNNVKIRELITGSDQHAHSIKNQKNVYDIVNKMNSVEFSINTDLLDYILNEGSYLLEGNFTFSENWQNTVILEIAKCFKNTKYYLPVHIDWRGRYYPMVNTFSYQGNELARALIDLNKGFKLSKSGLRFLLIYGCNLYNENELSRNTFKNRIKWVIKNKSNILSMNKNFIKGAEKPIQFTAFCLAYKKYIKDNNAIIKFPVHVDATCSGIQHLAALIKDSELALKVNIIRKVEMSKPSDIYDSMRKVINLKLGQKGDLEKELNLLREINVKRKHVKKSIMTTTYNVTRFGVYHQLEEVFKTDDFIIIETNNKGEKVKTIEKRYKIPTLSGKDIIIGKKEFKVIVDCVYKILFDEYPILQNVYKYFIEMAKVMNKLEIPIIWKTPMGLEITQKYLKTEQNKVSIQFFKKRHTFVLHTKTNKINTQKQVYGILPNIIHSLDANHVGLVIKKAWEYDIKNVFTIHDCFGTHPNNIEKLGEIIRLEFVKLYSEFDYFSEFQKLNFLIIKKNNFEIKKVKDKYLIYKNKELLKNIKIPNIPHKGELNLKKEIISEYFVN